MAVQHVSTLYNNVSVLVAVSWSGSPVDLRAGDVLVYIDMGVYTSTAQHATAVTVPNTAFTKVGGVLSVQWWVGTVSADVASGWSLTTTAQPLGGGSRRRGALVVFRGVASAAATVKTVSSPTGAVTTPEHLAGNGQAVLVAGYSDSAANARTGRTPVGGWDDQGSPFDLFGDGTRIAQLSVRTPAKGLEDHTLSAFRSGARVDATSLVIGEYADYEPEPEPEPEPVHGFKAWDGIAWAEYPVRVNRGGTWIRARVRRYGGPGWPMSHEDRIDAATSVADVQQVLNEAVATHGASVEIRQAGAIGGGSYASATTVDDGYIRTCAKAFVTAIHRHPSPLLGGWKFYLGRNLMLSGREVSGFYFSKGVYLNTDTTDAALANVTSDRYHNGIFTTHHEIAHGLWEQKTGTALTAYKNEMAASQPPGFAWLGASASSTPYEGEHPIGFPRAYSRTDANEDQADIVGWVLTEHLWQRDGERWFETDQYLAAKAAAARKWLTSLGFTGLA